MQNPQPGRNCSAMLRVFSVATLPVWRVDLRAGLSDILPTRRSIPEVDRRNPLAGIETKGGDTIHLEHPPVALIITYMRKVGKTAIARPTRVPTGSNLALAAVHQRTGQALAAVMTTGIAKGLYRFATHEEMNRHSDEALTRAIAANLRQRAFPAK